MRINITFKHNVREIRLFDAVQNSINKSAFIKECIEYYLDNYNKSEVVVNKEIVEEEPTTKEIEVDWSDIF